MSPLAINITAIVAAGLAGGCGAEKHRSHPGPLNRGEVELIKPPPTTSTTEQRPLPIRANPTLVKQGPTPLVYLVETGDPIFVVVTDLTTGVNLARVACAGRTIVRVESRNGVYVGTKQALAGPLPSAHSYGIYIEVDQPSIMENRVIRPQVGSWP